jgi:dephospho-CoA kinase
MKSKAKKHTIVIGITGEIAAGKSLAASFLREKGIQVIDADKIGHEILVRNNVKNQLVKTFGKQILASDNIIDRQVLGKIVFTDLRRLEQLNNVVHPILIDEIINRIKTSQDKFLVIDAALLCDWKLNKICDYTILITADSDLRVQRLVKDKGLSPQEAKNRISAQKVHCDKVDFVIENNESCSDFRTKIERIWRKIYGGSGKIRKENGGECRM